MEKKLLMLGLCVGMFFGCKKSDPAENITLYPVKSGDTYEYIDREGKIIINPQFEEAGIFRDGIALVKTAGDNGKWGYIDEDGKYIINPSYKSATIFSEDIAWVVSENGAPTAIDKTGEIKFSLQNAENVKMFKGGLAGFSEQKDTTGAQWGFVDASGKIKILPQFSAVGYFSEGKCWVLNKEDKYGYIDAEGKIDINYQFDAAGNFENGRAVVSLKEKMGVIGANGRYIINPQYEEIVIDGDRYLIKKDGKYGWCDRDGKIVINPQFDDASGFGSGKLAAVKTGKQYGYIDTEGKFVINPQFDFAAPFNNGIAIIETGNKIGFIDNAGKFTVNPQFDNISMDLYAGLYGRSLYSLVITDFFNVNAIIATLNLAKPQGLSLKDNISTVLDKMQLSVSELDKYADYQTLIKSKKINPDVSMKFEMLGNPFYYPAYSYTRQLNPQFMPKGYYYEITLSGRGEGRGDQVRKALLDKTANMTLIKTGLDKSSPVSILKDTQKQVVIISSESSLRIFVLRTDFDLSGYMSGLSANDSESGSTEEYQETIDTTVVYDTTATAY